MKRSALGAASAVLLAAACGGGSSNSAVSELRPQERGYASLVDLPGTGVAMFGGFTIPKLGPDFLPELWAYTPGPAPRWRKLPTQNPPTPGDPNLVCNQPCTQLIYRSVDGGTWLRDVEGSSAWHASASLGPGYHGMGAVFDSQSNRMLMFGGDNFDSLPLAETWAYDPKADRWTKMHPAISPPPRYFFATTYDEKADRMIVFGGFGTNDKQLSDTWAYDFDHDSWTELRTATSPSPRGYVSMAYDPIAGHSVLYGGVKEGESALDDMWWLDVTGPAWTRVDASGPGPRAWHAMTFDRENGEFVMFGGGRNRDYSNEVWLLASGSKKWTRG